MAHIIRKVTISKKPTPGHHNSVKSDRFSDLCPPDVLKTLTQGEVQRQETIYELIKTEKQYVADMSLVVSLFLQPIRERQLLTKQKIGSLFSNIETLVTVNQQLLQELENRQKESIVIDKVGDIFVDKGSLFKLYAVYCSNQSTVPALLAQCMQESEPFAAYLKECSAKPECRAMLLTDFLIQPLQRICKYPLLLRAIMKSTSQKHADFEQLSIAVEKVESVVEQINDRTRQVNNVQRLQELRLQLQFEEDFELLQHGRYFVRETFIKKSLGVIDGKSTNLRLILFSDIILMCTERENTETPTTGKSSSRQSKNITHLYEYVVRRVIPLFVAGSPKVLKTDKLQSNALEIIECHEWPIKKHILLMDSEAERDAWADDIKKFTDLYLQQYEREKQATAAPPPKSLSSHELSQILRTGGDESAFPGIRMHGDDVPDDSSLDKEALKKEKKTSLKKQQKTPRSSAISKALHRASITLGSAATTSSNNLRDLVKLGDNTSSADLSNPFVVIDGLTHKVRELEEEMATLKQQLKEEKEASARREEDFNALKDQVVYIYRLVTSNSDKT